MPGDQRGRGSWRLGHRVGLRSDARASAVVGDGEAAAAWNARAVEALDGIADQDDRDVVENDLATLPEVASSNLVRADTAVKTVGWPCDGAVHEK